MLKDILINKYGDEITNHLFAEGRLISNIQPKNDKNQAKVKEQINKINEKLELGLDVQNTKWAFDFSGWLNSLNRNPKGDKKYMIIGLEPHVERYDFQITYGLSNKSPNGIDRFRIDLFSKEFPIICEDDSSLMWSNLFKILADNELKREVLQSGNIDKLMSFLNQFYITDLCHFAPQDKAKAINNIKDWNKVRLEVAIKYLKPEMELIQPEIILAQGNSVFKELKRIFKFKEGKKYPIRFGKVAWYIKTGHSSEYNFRIISLPHFGSKMNYNTFWKNNRNLVRNVIFENSLLEENNLKYKKI